DHECAAFFDILEACERPLIYAGGGVISAEAAEELRTFSRAFRIPIVTTLMGLGACDTTDDLSMGMLGMHGAAYANYAVEDCDFLIAVASRFDDRVAGNPERFAPRARTIAHFDIDPSEIHKVKSVDWHHVGPLGDALRRLIEYGRERNVPGSPDHWLEEVRTLKEKYAFRYDEESDLIQPQHVLETINELTDSDAIIATGVGQHQMWAAQYLDFRGPRQWLTSGSMGTMGFGLPAAIGAQFARPDRMVIDVDGDASIRMNLGELETVTTYDLPVKVLVVNNLGDGMVKQWQKLFFKGRLSASDKSLRKKDFVKAAEADGFAWARRLSRKSEVEPVIREFVEFDGPAFLEVMIDPDAGVYPMVGPGQTYKDMITGDFIPSRTSPEAAATEIDPSDML
ncbi:MAG: thiamine pyrophosphate-binding protein, partial [Longimicrobiales bacterium]